MVAETGGLRFSDGLDDCVSFLLIRREVGDEDAQLTLRDAVDEQHILGGYSA